MIDIKEHITNPFRDNPTDFSEMIQAARSINTCRAFFKAGQHPPYAHKNRTNPAALPPQLIVRQIISSRLKKRMHHQQGSSPLGTPGGVRVNPVRQPDPTSPGNSGKNFEIPSPTRQQQTPPVTPSSAATPKSNERNTYL